MLVQIFSCLILFTVNKRGTHSRLDCYAFVLKPKPPPKLSVTLEDGASRYTSDTYCRLTDT